MESGWIVRPKYQLYYSAMQSLRIGPGVFCWVYYDCCNDFCFPVGRFIIKLKK